ncbi:DUF1801 domain-containing protein [Flavobacterium sp.]|uniref:DUF1801 domain-containing protein n=1 Tax=Flavobacterium sp. TaxID=239 RepID=UPI002607DDD4|nr:DUF1801 domain-containing protein [Flavobacterium sp.]MDG2431588.1 DUF1801 domain-containing protein [Flavobacterium sp.]
MNVIADNIPAYIEKLPEQRKQPIYKLLLAVRNNIPKGFQETISYGMIGFVVPHSIYPSGYHCDPKLPLPFINIASQKNFIAIYHAGIYANPELLEWFTKEYPNHCKTKLDMGKSCIRFKKMDDIPYELIAELSKKITVTDWIESYELHFKKTELKKKNTP